MHFPIALLLLLPLAAQAAGDRFASHGVQFSIAVRDAAGVAAFYNARGFSKPMAETIAQTCFVGVGIHNERSDTLWLELSNWRFIDAAGRELKRIARPEWDARWDKINAPLAARAAFDWTQLPESRDLQPGEPVGGNVAVAAPNSAFSLSARFRTGSGDTFEIAVPGLRCPNEAKP